jgi:opacity protein-like surface antigen
MRLSIFILAFLTTALLAQTPDSLKTKKWAVSLSYSPDFCYRTPYTKSDEVGTTDIKEKGKMGFTAGVNVLYRLLDRIGIEFGALYSTKGEKVSAPAFSWYAPAASTYDPSIPNSGQSEYITSPERKTSYTFQYLEIPLKINVYLINTKFKVFPSIGCSANLFMGKKTMTTFLYENGRKEKEVSHTYEPKNIPSAEFAILAGIGLGYDINKNIFVKLEPSFRTFIRPLVDGPISGTLYSVGANAGIYFNF